MTRPKKWYLKHPDAGDANLSADRQNLTLVYSDGSLIKKPNAGQSLGNIQSVSPIE